MVFRSKSAAIAILVSSLLSSFVRSQYQYPDYQDPVMFENEILTESNKWRELHQSPDTTYNTTMAAAAATYASMCIFSHPALTNQGSNLAAGFATATDVIDAWYDEVQYYNYSNPGPNNVGPGGSTTLHFTQVVWAASTEIGCGAYFCNGVNNVPGWYVVCYYMPEGNIVLEGDEGFYFETNVLPILGQPTSGIPPTASSTIAGSSSSSSTIASSTASGSSSSSAATTASSSSVSSSTIPSSSSPSSMSMASGVLTGSASSISGTGIVMGVAPAANPIASSSPSSAVTPSPAFPITNATSTGPNGVIDGTDGNTVIQATEPTIISTDGIVFIVNPTTAPGGGGSGASLMGGGASGSPGGNEVDGIALPTGLPTVFLPGPPPDCPDVPVNYVMLSGGVINLMQNMGNATYR